MRTSNRKPLGIVLLLPAAYFTTACSGAEDNGADPDREDPIVERAFDDYDEPDEARQYCAARDEDEEDDEAPSLQDGQLLLLDAAPQCDLDQFGDEVIEGENDRLIVDASTLSDAPSLALCSCTDLEASNVIEAPGDSDIIGDVGANERIFASAPIRIDGRVISSGEARFDNVLEANGLEVENTLTASNEVTIHDDATLGGLDIPGSRVDVTGTLTVPEGTDLSSVDSSGQIVYDDLEVEPPCDCSEDVDYDALREDFRDIDDDDDDDFENYAEVVDDEAQYLYPAPPRLLSGLNEERTVHLACGKYYFDEIQSSAALTIVAVGDVDIFVDGDVNVAGPLVITAEEDASLDLYVAGSFTPDNTVDLGRPSEPDALRFYVRDEVRLAGPTVLSGSLFCPNAPAIFDNTLESEGAILARSLDFAAPIRVTDGPRFTPDACLLWDEADTNTAE